MSSDGLALDLTWKSLETKDLPMVFALAGTAAPAGLRIEGERPLTLALRVAPAGTVTATGRLAASVLALDTLTLTKVEAPLAFDGRSVEVNPLTFSLYGGQETGSFAADVSASPATWRLLSTIQGVDINALLSANTSARDRLEGKGQLRLDLRGRAGMRPEQGTSGTVALALTNGVVRNLPLLASINRALGITAGEGNDTRFERLSGTFAVAGGQLTTNDLQVHAGELRVLAAGTIGFDQRLALDGRAVLSRAKTEELRKQSPHVSAQRNEQGELEVPFTIAGTASTPEVSIRTGDMLRRAAEKELQRSLKRGLDRLFK